MSRLFSKYARYVRVLKPLALLFAAAAVLMPGASSADMRIEEEVGHFLVKEFDPESIVVQATNGGSFLYAKATGIVIEGVRIDSISMSAMMKEPPKNVARQDPYKLADLIYMSWGEVIIKENDIADYCRKEVEDIKGFTDLKCDFTPDGIHLSGIYTAKFLFTFKIRLAAVTKVAFDDSGLYLTNAKFFINGVKQPDAMTDGLLKEINPLIKREKIPFPVRITKIYTTDDKIVLTGNPKKFTTDNVWKYTKP